MCFLKNVVILYFPFKSRMHFEGFICIRGEIYVEILFLPVDIQLLQHHFFNHLSSHLTVSTPLSKIGSIHVCGPIFVLHSAPLICFSLFTNITPSSQKYLSYLHIWTIVFSLNPIIPHVPHDIANIFFLQTLCQ